MEKEFEICRKSPFHFATKYLVILDENGIKHPFTTRLTERNFNSLFIAKNTV